MRHALLILIATGMLCLAGVSGLHAAHAQSTTTILDIFDDGP